MTAAVTDHMYQTDLMHTGIWFVFILMAVYFAGLSSAVLVRKKPIIISTGWFRILFILIFVPQVIGSLFSLFEHFKNNAAEFSGISMILFAGLGDVWSDIFFLLTFSAFLMYLIFKMQGYTLIGVNETAIRDAIYYGLQKMDIPYKETRAWIKLTELDARLQIKMRSWGSEGEIKVKGRPQRAFLRELAKHMRVYLKEQKIPIRNAGAILYLITGIFVMAFALSEIIPKGWIDIF